MNRRESRIAMRVARHLLAASAHKLRVFDCDDTLISSEGSVGVEPKGGENITLNSSEFANYTPQEGDKQNFKEFNHVTKPRVIKSGFDALKKDLADPEARVVVLTARPKGASSSIKKFLHSKGIDNVDVVALQSSDPADKAKWIEDEVNKGGIDDVQFTDDSERNVRAVQGIKSSKARIGVKNPPKPEKDEEYEGPASEEEFKSDDPTEATVEYHKKPAQSPKPDDQPKQDGKPEEKKEEPKQEDKPKQPPVLEKVTGPLPEGVKIPTNPAPPRKHKEDEDEDGKKEDGKGQGGDKSQADMAWWKNQKPKFQQEYCKNHPGSKFCK